MLVRGRSLWKNGSAASFSAPLVMPYAFALIRVQVTPAAAERQERSDRVSEEASYHRNLHFLLYALPLHFPCHMKHFHNVLLIRNILSQYTLR
jgi:hypothetical protein